MKMFHGVGASSGIALGIANIIYPLHLNKNTLIKVSPEEGVRKFEHAVGYALDKIQTYLDKAQDKNESEIRSLYKAYLLMLKDEDYLENIRRNILQRECVSTAIAMETERLALCLAKAKSPYLTQRAEDLRAVQKMLNEGLYGESRPSASETLSTLVLFSEELTPADTMNYDQSCLKGFVTRDGGITSHSVILAKELGIPAIVGANFDLSEVSENEKVIIDGTRGIVFLDPDDTTLALYQEKIEEQNAYFNQVKSYLNSSQSEALPVKVCANISSLTEAKNAVEQFADGVGLVRSEFLYMNRHDFPSEDEQFEFYKQLALTFPGKEVVVRTLDIGGDKQAGYIGIAQEENPFLGFRAIRYCLANPNVFRCQLRALLRASAFGNINILVPMITSLEELIATKALLEEEKEKLKQEEIHFNRNIRLGIMIETPAAAIMADNLAAHCDFFSIGSNDLIQYITASDRNNSQTQYLYSACEPSVLRAINLVAESAKRAGIPVHVCGEIASDELLVPFLLASGICELSVSSGAIPRVKYLLSKITRADTAQLVKDIQQAKLRADIEAILMDFSNTMKVL